MAESAEQPVDKSRIDKQQVRWTLVCAIATAVNLGFVIRLFIPIVLWPYDNLGSLGLYFAATAIWTVSLAYQAALLTGRSVSRTAFQAVQALSAGIAVVLAVFMVAVVSLANALFSGWFELFVVVGVCAVVQATAIRRG
ncbi:hypothetical protein [Haloglycomyces albus]|uniref:hypothetical protein n=1 Tax=Haloglycomyces albus TaxID=526067 RepID=UPI00046CC31B|nr:hypothetical protein [Haloglycomyces albus]